ncbi:hypothetical protein AN1V17_25340 [Vallitalea sediminicola]
MKSKFDSFINEYKTAKNLMISQDNHVSEMKKKLVIKDNDIARLEKNLIDFNNSIHMKFLPVYEIYLEEDLNEWDKKIKRNKAKLQILDNIKNDFNNNRLIHRSNKEKLTELYINKFEYEIKVFIECKKLEQLELNYFNCLRVLEENSIIVGEGSLVTLKFDCDEEIYNFLIDGNYYKIEKGKSSFIQSHISKVKCDDCEYELLNSTSKLGSAIKGKRVGDIVEYSSNEETFRVNVILIKYAL